MFGWMKKATCSVPDSIIEWAATQAMSKWANEQAWADKQAVDRMEKRMWGTPLTKERLRLESEEYADDAEHSEKDWTNYSTKYTKMSKKDLIKKMRKAKENLGPCVFVDQIDTDDFQLPDGLINRTAGYKNVTPATSKELTAAMEKMAEFAAKHRLMDSPVTKEEFQAAYDHTCKRDEERVAVHRDGKPPKIESLSELARKLFLKKQLEETARAGGLEVADPPTAWERIAVRRARDPKSLPKWPSGLPTHASWDKDMPSLFCPNVSQCMIEGCRNVSKRRGLCEKCHSAASLHVNSGLITWEHLEYLCFAMPLDGKEPIVDYFPEMFNGAYRKFREKESLRSDCRLTDEGPLETTTTEAEVDEAIDKLIEGGMEDLEYSSRDYDNDDSWYDNDDSWIDDDGEWIDSMGDVSDDYYGYDSADVVRGVRLPWISLPSCFNGGARE